MNARSLVPLVVFAFIATRTSAALVEYTVDPAASLFHVSGTLAGATLTEQSPGTSTTGFGGSFGGERGANTLSLDTHDLHAIDQATPQLPVAGDSRSPFGLRGTSPFAGQVLVNIDSLQLYVSTQFQPPLDVADGRFSPSDIGFFVSGGSLYFSTDGIPLELVDLHGKGAPNVAPGEGTLVVSGNVETLRIPIETTFALNTPDDTLTISGELVARRTIPEPSTMLLAGFAGFSLLSWRRR